ncbi:MAG: aldo/keto reductase [Pseudomonadota bacterium]
MTAPLRWGLLAAGSIAHAFGEALRTTPGATLAAVASRDSARAETFADKFRNDFPALKAYGGSAGYDTLIDDPDVDIVYVSTPHPDHARWTVRALEAGKHVLCEKPAGLNHADVMVMVDAAEQAQRFFMEAFMYRCHPKTLALKALIDDGAIGELRHLRASFGFNASVPPDHRLLNEALGGGSLLDVGCYPLSLARLLFAEEPESLTGSAQLGPTGVDRFASAQLAFSRGRTAQIASGIELTLDNRIEAYGSAGQLRVSNPWHGADSTGHWSITLTREGQQPERIEGTASNLYRIEAEEVGRCIAAGQLESERMLWQDSLNNAIALDRWRDAVGLTYRSETPAGHRGPIRGYLRPAPPAQALPRVPWAPLDRSLSKLVMGCDNQPNLSHASALWDHFVELGGNVFDTAWIYGGGSMESLFGHWHHTRALRDEIVLIGKGAHTPHCTPAAVERQLEQSLDRLQSDHIDVYFLHRDNPEVPVGEFMSVLNDLMAAGKLRALGASNWSLSRLEEANGWAKQRGLTPFVALSNNFSLAQMINPIWPGTVTANTHRFRDYLEREQLALFPWSAQARGFFTPRFDAVLSGDAQRTLSLAAMEPDLEEMRRCWFSDANVQRRQRAQQLAAARGTSAIAIALAFVAALPWPCFPLIGPRRLAETRSSAAALAIDLSAEERAWLDLESDQPPATLS